MTYTYAKRKLWLEQAVMFPFVLLGRIAGYFFKLKTPHQVFLFLSNGDIGGSPQVNIDLLHCLRDKNPLVIFSKKPGNNQFRDKYNLQGVRVLDIHKYIDNKLFHFVNFFFRGLLATWINRQNKTVVFGGETIYFYKVIPHLKKEVHCVELSHLDIWLPYSIGFIDRVDLRIFSTEKLKQKAAAQYLQNNLPARYYEKLFFTDNAIDIPTYKPAANKNLQVYFIGRGAPQKRVHLTAAIAKQVHQLSLPVRFNFVGDVEKIINPADFPYCSFFGNISDQAKMKAIYEEADVLIMTSAFEGLPIVVMQMMAHGKVVVSTAVNAIPDYIHHMENGLLISATDEEGIVKEGVSYISMLAENPALRLQLGMRSREIAVEKFSREHFCSTYRRYLRLD
ncbi:MAG: glycosyltransferase family 4 protein [Ferruginibacter sp.]|nr:glycosyltransferase family 4 protein [Ferruginibacter sp.]